MAIYIETAKPKVLLDKIIKLIDENKITTWLCDSDGNFKYIAEQYEEKALFKPILINNCLIFGIKNLEDEEISRVIDSIYHGRFIEMLINHLYSYFKFVNASSEEDLKYDEI